MVQYQPPTEWQQWVDWLAAGLHGRSRWRLSLIIMGIVLLRGVERLRLGSERRARAFRMVFAGIWPRVHRVWAELALD